MVNSSIRTIYCATCGRVVRTKSPRQMYCEECAHQSHIEQQRRYRLKAANKPKLTATGDCEITQINKRAHALGMSYGKYLVKYGEKGESK